MKQSDFCFPFWTKLPGSPLGLEFLPDPQKPFNANFLIYVPSSIWHWKELFLTKLYAVWLGSKLEER